MGACAACCRCRRTRAIGLSGSWMPRHPRLRAGSQWRTRATSLWWGGVTNYRFSRGSWMIRRYRSPTSLARYSESLPPLSRPKPRHRRSVVAAGAADANPTLAFGVRGSVGMHRLNFARRRVDSKMADRVCTPPKSQDQRPAWNSLMSRSAHRISAPHRLAGSVGRPRLRPARYAPPLARLSRQATPWWRSQSTVRTDNGDATPTPCPGPRRGRAAAHPRPRSQPTLLMSCASGLPAIPVSL
jgi:hypothetical protein